MIGCGHFSRNQTFIMATLVLLGAASARSAVAKSQWEPHQNSPSSLGFTVPALRVDLPQHLRLAKTYKYEIPKAQRAPIPAPQSSAPAVQSVPLNSGPPVINRGKYRGTPGPINRGKNRGTARAKPSGASDGSCELCRNSCYVNYRVNSFSRQFVPCMHACWNQLCRR